MTGVKDWADALDRRELNGVRVPILLVSLAATALLPWHDPYLASATMAEYISALLFHFMMVTLGAVGVYALWIAFAPHDLLAVFPGYRRGTDSAKAVKKMRDEKEEKAKSGVKAPSMPDMTEDEEEPEAG